MTGPIDAVMAIHNAFRHDMSLIDAAAVDSARGKPGLEATVERFRFFNEVLEWHAHGEELAIFPALEAVAPSVAEAYEKDHRALDAAFNALNKAVSVHDPLETARATKAFKFFLGVHLDKEDAHLYRLIKERSLTQAEAGKILGIKQPHVSALMRNRSGTFSVERLLDFLTALGQDVQITVRPTRKPHGEVSVVA